MYDVQKTFNIMSLFFFIPLVFIGAFFLLNLTLVVIKSKFTEEHENNKEAKKKRIHTLKKMSKEDIKKQKEAKNAYTKLRVINRKLEHRNRDRKDSDENIVERIRKNNKQKRLKNIDSLIMSKIDSEDPDGKAQIPKDTTTRGKGKGRANIFGIKSLLKKDGAKDAIVEERTESADQDTHMPKERGFLYLKQGRGKLKMEGMYGISRKHDNVNFGSNSDLLEDIPLSLGDDDNDTDGADNMDSKIEVPESEIMFPLDSSLTNSTKNKKNSNEKNSKDKEGESDDKAKFSISESSYEIDNESIKHSPAKANGFDNKTGYYYTGANISAAGDNDTRQSKDNLQKFNTLKKMKDQDDMVINKNTKISSKLEKDIKFKPSNTMTDDNTTVGKAADFSIKQLISITKQKMHERRIMAEFNKNEINEGEDDDKDEYEIKHEHLNKTKDKDEVIEIESRELDDMDIEDIQVVKKGMKIHIKREAKFNNLIDTNIDEIIKKKHDDDENEDTEREKYKHNDEDEDKQKKKTSIPPYNLQRRFEPNEHLLEGRIESDAEEEVEDKENKEKSEAKKAEEMKNFEPGDKSADAETEESENNLYVEKFKFQYRSNLIATGTVSIVVSAKNSELLTNIQHPCAVMYGNVIQEDDESELEDTKELINEKHLGLRRNDTILPGNLMRQGTTNSKTVPNKTKKEVKKRIFTNKKAGGRKGRDEEENSEENKIKKLILDIPEHSPFFPLVDKKKYEKDEKEDQLLNESDDENEDEDSFIDESESDVDIEDIFLDRDIDFDLELERARNAAARRPHDRTEWSGQDVKIDFDPYYALIATEQLSSIVIFPYGIFGAIVKIRSYVNTFVLSSFFENLMTVAVAINTIVLSLDHHGISKSQENTLTTMNFYFTMIFISEMGLKLFGIGVIGYLKDKMNYLDGMVVILSIFELAFLSGGGALSAFRAVRIMRTFRVLRVARLLKSMQSMQTIIDVIGRSIGSFFYLAMLLLLFIFIYALLGMQTYGGKFYFDDGVPRGNFDTFNTAFITVFQVMTMENWPDILTPCMRSDVNKILTSIYLISWIFIGNFMLLNLFLAILLDSFAEDDDAEANKKKSPEELKEDALEAKEEFLSKKGEELILDYSDTVMNGSKGSRNKAGGFVKQTKKKLKNDKQLDESFELEDVAMKKKKAEIKEKLPDYWGIECQRSFYLFHYKNIIRYA